MTRQFHGGQDVEVAIAVPVFCNQNDPPVYHELEWRKAKVIVVPGDRNQFLVRFPDGSRGVFVEEHIRIDLFTPDRLKTGKSSVADHAHNFSRPEHEKRRRRRVSP
jgi:hypothetical protein